MTVLEPIPVHFHVHCTTWQFFHTNVQKSAFSWAELPIPQNSGPEQSRNCHRRSLYWTEQGGMGEGTKQSRERAPRTRAKTTHDTRKQNTRLTRPQESRTTGWTQTRHGRLHISITVTVKRYTNLTPSAIHSGKSRCSSNIPLACQQIGAQLLCTSHFTNTHTREDQSQHIHTQVRHGRPEAPHKKSVQRNEHAGQSLRT